MVRSWTCVSRPYWILKSNHYIKWNVTEKISIRCSWSIRRNSTLLCDQWLLFVRMHRNNIARSDTVASHNALMMIHYSSTHLECAAPAKFRRTHCVHNNHENNLNQFIDSLTVKIIKYNHDKYYNSLPLYLHTYFTHIETIRV